MATPEPLIRPPLQRRSQESLERLLHAGFEVLKEEGFEGFTLQEVSRRAGVSIGSIYARVPSREALIMAIYERAMAWTELEQNEFVRNAERLDLDARERVETIVTEMAETMLAQSDVLRVFCARRRSIQRSGPVAPKNHRRPQRRSRRRSFSIATTWATPSPSLPSTSPSG
jgi:AcrR family transcriptional regulator